jgi:uracil-DNA glycosylase
VIKYRTDDHSDRHYRAAYEAFLREELAELDPEVLFVFGGSAWDTVRGQAALQPPADLNADQSNITAVHGYPFTATAPTETTVVPLVHFSGRIYHSLLRDSYFEYLSEGLSEL